MTLRIQQEIRKAQYYSEQLGDATVLEMVLIPGGSFLMGSPATELERYDDEEPQHSVTVPSFFMGKYPVTQVQWQFVANLPQVNRPLAGNSKRSLDPDPSNFKGSDRPVEQVSWYEAVEFCDRLAQLTKRPYRLPSEAEWEYACRAGTTTPFHFGNTITPDLANYNWDVSYGTTQISKQKDFEGTTTVGQFGFANHFGLYDMHGNVWEWCEDHWHDSYKGAPSDGSAWIDANANEDASRVVRGGSWHYDPRNCRSATRGYFEAGRRNFNLGFRVVLSAPRTL